MCACPEFRFLTSSIPKLVTSLRAVTHQVLHLKFICAGFAHTRGLFPAFGHVSMLIAPDVDHAYFPHTDTVSRLLVQDCQGTQSNYEELVEKQGGPTCG